MCFRNQKKNRLFKKKKSKTENTSQVKNWVQNTLRAILGCKVNRLTSLVKSPKCDAIITHPNLNKQTKALVI